MNPEDVKDGFFLIDGGTFLMGSPESENRRIDDETQHSVTVSAFYIDKYETTQKELKTAKRCFTIAGYPSGTMKRAGSAGATRRSLRGTGCTRTRRNFSASASRGKSEADVRRYRSYPAAHTVLSVRRESWRRYHTRKRLSDGV